MSSEVIAAIIALLGGVAGKSIVDWIRDWTKGRMDQAQKIQRKLDKETARRRDAEAAYHSVRITALKAGVPAEQIASLPSDDDN